jgi:signal transduction histidine kinase
MAAGAILGATRLAAAQAWRSLTLPPAFVIERWTTREGLPQNSVNAMASAPDGSLWIGTFGGLVRFDGASFRLLERIDSAGRHVDRVLSLAVGADGALWVGTEQGLLRYRDHRYDTWQTTRGLPDGAVSALCMDHAGVLWIGTPNGLAWRAGDRLVTLTELQGRRLGPVTSIVEDAQGTVWVNAGDGLVAIADGTQTPRWAAPPVRGAVSMVLQDRSGARWFGLPDGVASVSPRAVRVYGRSAGVHHPSVMAEDPGGGYWLGTANDGLVYLQPGGGRNAAPYALPDGRQHYRVRAALVDGEGDVWFGTNASGLLRARRNLFTTFTAAQGLSHDVATAVTVDASGEVWEGTNCFGVNVIDLARLTVRTLKPRRPGDPTGDPCVFALTEASPGTMWAGTYGGGLTRLRGGRAERLYRAGGLRDSVVLALFTDRAGTVWVGTNSGGLAMLRGTRVQAVYTTADGLANNSVRAIAQSHDGALWLGTLGGLSRLQDGRFTTWTAADGLSAQQVRAIYQDADGDLWIGTYGGGLDRFHAGAFAAVTRRDGLAEDVVSSILEDDQGRLWLSGNRGVSRVARRELVAFTERRVRRVHAVLYDEDDGLRNAETNGGFQPAAWKDARGRLWYPTVRGLAMVDPARAKAPDRPPAAAVEEVMVDGEPRAPADGMVVGPGRPNLEFRYSGISLSATKHLTFRYRLVGFDDDWVDAGSRRVAYYPRLAAGRYRFVVSAANRDGVWNEAGTELRLRVAAAVWNTWWFQLVAAAGALGLVVAGARRRMLAARLRQAAREEFSRRLIESQEHERKRIAGELHDGLGQELLVVKNRALLALRTSDLPRPAREQLQHITDIVTRSLEGVRGLAHNLAPYQLDHLGLSEALRTMIASAAAGVNIAFHTTIEDVDGLLPAEREINLYRIVQEGVNNVVRHSRATRATVHVRRDGEVIAVTISDDGRGFQVRRDAASGLTGGFGLSGIAERVRILGGHLDAASAPGEGTRVEVTAPIAPPSPAGPP